MTSLVSASRMIIAHRHPRSVGAVGTGLVAALAGFAILAS